MPYSLVAHWIPNLYECKSASLLPSVSFRSHYVKIPNPGEIFYTAKDILDEMKELIAKHEEDNCKQS